VDLSITDVLILVYDIYTMKERDLIRLLLHNDINCDYQYLAIETGPFKRNHIFIRIQMYFQNFLSQFFKFWELEEHFSKSF